MNKVLKVLSVIILVFAVIYIIVGVLAIVGSSQVADVATAIDEELDAASITIFSQAAGIVAIVSGCLNLLVGCLGFRGANNRRGSLTAAIVLMAISVALTIYGMVGSPITWQSISNLVFPAAFLVAAVSTRSKLN